MLEQAPRFAGSALADALVADEARTGLRPAVAVVVDAEPLGDIARATWRMAPIGTAVLTGPAGTSGFAHHFDERPATVCKCAVAQPASRPVRLAELRTRMDRVN